MKIKDSAKYLPLVQAAEEGKTIQYYAITTGWIDCLPSYEGWMENPEFYRIKPEPKLRPWKESEVPVGVVIRGLGHSYRSMILGVNKSLGSVWFCSDSKIVEYSLSEMLECYEYSTDGMGDFYPCGVLENDRAG